MRLVIFSEINSEFGYLFIQEILKHKDIELVALVTQSDEKLCSYYLNDDIQYNLKLECRLHQIKVLQFDDINDSSALYELRKLNPDYFIIANYTQILKDITINIAKKMTIVFHPSMLPKYAGLAPFFWIARHGERQSGVSAFKIAEKIDTGDIIRQIPIKLKGTETTIEIRRVHFEQSVNLLKMVLEDIKKNNISLKKQDLRKRTYYGAPTEHDLLLDWRLDAENILNVIRAGYRHPGAFFVTARGDRVSILSASKVNLYFIGIENRRSFPGKIIFYKNKVYIRCLDSYIEINTISFLGKEVSCTLNLLKSVDFIPSDDLQNALETMLPVSA